MSDPLLINERFSMAIEDVRIEMVESEEMKKQQAALKSVEHFGTAENWEKFHWE